MLRLVPCAWIVVVTACGRLSGQEAEERSREDGHVVCEKRSDCEDGQTCYARKCMSPEAAAQMQHKPVAPASPSTPPSSGNPAHDLLLAKSEVDRGGALAEVVRSAKHHCRSASRTFFQGSASNGDAFWDVQCDRGEAFAVSISSDPAGSTRVLPCSVLTREVGVQCFETLDRKTHAEPKTGGHPPRAKRKPASSTEPAAAAPKPESALAEPSPAREPAARSCCKYCTNSQPCGNSCIAFGKTCHKASGCAC